VSLVAPNLRRRAVVFLRAREIICGESNDDPRTINPRTWRIRTVSALVVDATMRKTAHRLDIASSTSFLYGEKVEEDFQPLQLHKHPHVRGRRGRGKFAYQSGCSRANRPKSARRRTSGRKADFGGDAVCSEIPVRSSALRIHFHFRMRLATLPLC